MRICAHSKEQNLSEPALLIRSIWVREIRDLHRTMRLAQRSWWLAGNWLEGTSRLARFSSHSHS